MSRKSPEKSFVGICKEESPWKISVGSHAKVCEEESKAVLEDKQRATDLKMDARVEALEQQLATALSEVTRLKDLTNNQQTRIQSMRDDLARVTPSSPARGAAGGADPQPSVSEKVTLPQKFDGSTSLTSYLVQFNTLASEQGWNDAKKSIILLGRLKGRALDVATQGEDHSFIELVRRLKRHFVPENEDMYAQQLQAVKKQTSQTWEDLAFQVRELARKAYKTANAATQDRLAISAFIEAIQEDKLRQKLRDSDLSTMEQVLQRIRKLEADQEIESQRGGSKKAVRAIQVGEEEEARIQKIEEQIQSLQTTSRGRGRRGANRTSRGNRGTGRPWPRGRGRGRGNGSEAAGLCYFCGLPDHYMRDCPDRKAWIEQQRPQQYRTTVAGTPQGAPTFLPQTNSNYQPTTSFATQSTPHLNSTR